jgi:hypothetical protein
MCFQETLQGIFGFCGVKKTGKMAEIIGECMDALTFWFVWDGSPD